jgi:hypothetical protein
MVLARELLNPITYQTQNPFTSIIEYMDKWLKEYQPDYYITKWPKVKYDYLKRILKLASNGSALRGHSQLAPTYELSTVLYDIYQLLDRSVYFTSRYWRAFYYWLKNGTLSPCWPQFGQKEIDLACSLLTQEDIEKLKIKANKEWLDFYTNEKAVADLFKKLKQPVYNLCFKRIAFLNSYDPAKYSMEDMQHQIYVSILIALRKNDYFTNQPSKMLGWAIKCADNAIHNLRNEALAEKRCRILDQSLNEEEPLSIPATTELLDSITILGEKSVLDDNIEDGLCLKELLQVADPKINTYLRTICCGEHNPDFWTWFYYNEPTLSQKIAYVEENPEALGPYLQRHLHLPTYEIVEFLKQHLPSLLEKTSNRILLAS